MKSEERHQLLTNDLEVVTTRTVSFLEKYAGIIVGAIVGIALFAAIGIWWTSTNEIDDSAGWKQLDTAQNLEEFGTVVDKFKGKAPGHWAQLHVAETNLKTGLPLMFTNREIAKADLKRAREGFDSLLQDKAAGAVIHERALWGLALCLEATCDGNTSRPIEAFERLTTEFPETMFKPIAEERIASLKKPGTKEFYTWFSKEDPKPPEVRPRDFKIDGLDSSGSSKSETKSDDDFLFSKDGEKKDPAAGKTETPKVDGEKAAAPAEPEGDKKPAAESKPDESSKPEVPGKTEESGKPDEAGKPDESKKPT